MYSYFHGTLVQTIQTPTQTAWIVEVGGIGYQILTNARNLQVSPAIGQSMQVFTSLIVREDVLQLVGFLSREERELFDILSSASGVGPKTALAILSDLSVSEIAGAILSKNHKALTVAKGVGPKLAEKMTVELREKMAKWQPQTASIAALETAFPQSPAIDEAQAVLLSLGYEVLEIQQALTKISKQQPDVPAMTAEQVLQAVLKHLSTQPV